jgi:ABC-type amino acid transport system permease subunit
MALILIMTALLCVLVMGGTMGVTSAGWDSVWKFRGVFWSGWLLTILISLLSLVFSCLIGLGVALARRSQLLPLRSAAML